MKKVITNYELETYVNTLNNVNSFRNSNTLKLPPDVRQAIRINLKTLNDRFLIFDEERRELVMSYCNEGKAVKNADNTVRIIDEYIPEYQNELVALATVKNALDLMPLPKESAEKILASDISMPEEDVVMLFMEADE